MASGADLLRERVKRVNTLYQKKTGSDRPPLLLAQEVPSPKVYPIGIHAIDSILGGGLCAGQTTVFEGGPGVGKTTTAFYALHSILEADPDACGLVLSFERALPVDSLRVAGFNMVSEMIDGQERWHIGPPHGDRIVVIQSYLDAEDALTQMCQFLYDRERRQPLDLIKLVILDSIAAMPTEAEINNAIDLSEGLRKDTVGELARLTSKLFRDLSVVLHEDTAVLAINQYRTKINPVGPAGKEGAGGQAVRYFPKTRIAFDSNPYRDAIKDGSRIIGHKIHVRVVKNNAGIGGLQGAETEYDVIYQKGVDLYLPVLQRTEESGRVKVNRSVYLIPQPEGEPLKIRGKEAVLDRMRAEPDFFLWMRQLAGDLPELPGEEDTPLEEPR